MITYKNLRDVEEFVDKNVDALRLALLKDIYTTIKAKVDVYKIGGILRWYKPEFVKTINVIRVSTTWRDFDNEHLELEGASEIEGLYNEYHVSIAMQNREARIIKQINNYKGT